MRLFREPLFHFFLLGLAIFGWFAWLNPTDPEAASQDQIVVDAQDAERLSAQFKVTWRRPPTDRELRGLIDSEVRQEVLVREAQALGLDQGDGVVRNRLAQKMTFLTTSVAQSLEPEDEVLKGYIAENEGTFVAPPRLALEQILLPQDADTTEVLNALQGGADPAELGERTLLPAQVKKSLPAAIDGAFGRGFFEQVSQQQSGQWSGPVQSSFGSHLVRVGEFEPASLPSFEEIRDDALLNWRREQSERLTTAQIDALSEQYEIVIPSDEELSQWSVQ